MSASGSVNFYTEIWVTVTNEHSIYEYISCICYFRIQCKFVQRKEKYKQMLQLGRSDQKVKISCRHVAKDGRKVNVYFLF